MGVGGVVGLSTAANVFVGMVEAPLFVRPWLARVTRGELFAIMAGGMASIAGTVLFLYASILKGVMPDAENSPGSAGPIAAAGASPRARASAVRKRRPSSKASMPDGTELNQYCAALSGSTARIRPPGRVTRASSASAIGTSRTCCRTATQKVQSNAPSTNGK